MAEGVAATAELGEAHAKLDETHAKLDAATARADAATARADAAVEKLRQDNLQTARNLKTMNLAVEQIATVTGLTVEEIAKL